MNWKKGAVQMEIRIELIDTLRDINISLNRVTSDKQQAILLNAKTNVLMALQKYEVEE